MKHICTLVFLLATGWLRGQEAAAQQYYISGSGDTIRGYFELPGQDKILFSASKSDQKQPLDVSSVSRLFLNTDEIYWVEEADEMAAGKLKTGKRRRMLLRLVFDSKEVKLFERPDSLEPLEPQLFILVGDGEVDALAFVEVRVPGKMTSRGYELERPLFFGGTEHYILHSLKQNEIISLKVSQYVAEKFVLRDTVLYRLNADWLRYWELKIANQCPKTRLQDDARYSARYLSRYLEEFRLCTKDRSGLPKRKVYTLTPFLAAPLLANRSPPASLGVQFKFDAAWGGVIGFSATQSILRTPRFLSPSMIYSDQNDDMRVFQVYLGYHLYRDRKVSFIPFVSYGEGSYRHTIYKHTLPLSTHSYRVKLRGLWIGSEICILVRERLQLNFTLMGLSSYEMRFGCSFLF